jgi:hypothetical protein
MHVSSQPRLLGECGQVSKAVHEALREVEEVHCSDQLMHFEFFGLFWELSEVRAELLTFLLKVSAASCGALNSTVAAGN